MHDVRHDNTLHGIDCSYSMRSLAYHQTTFVPKIPNRRFNSINSFARLRAKLRNEMSVELRNLTKIRDFK